MTVAEMITNFRLEYDNASLSAPSYESDEIIRFLEKSQLETVNQLFLAKEYALIEDLLLTATFTVAGPPAIGSSTTVPGGKTADLVTATTPRFMYYVTSYTEYVRSAAPVMSATIVQNQDIKKEEIKYYTTSAFNAPIFRYPKAVMDGPVLTVIVDGYSSTISKIIVDYVAEPQPLLATGSLAGHVTTCEVKPVLHDQIVKRAVELAMLVSDPARSALNTKIHNQ